jgi:mevalonate kinase
MTSKKHSYVQKARKQFFSECQFVAHTPGSYFWCSEHAVMYGQLAVIHVVPLYAYVGIKYGNYKKFEFEVRGIQKDVNVGLEDVAVEKMEPITQWYEQKRVEKYLEFWKGKNKEQYFKIKIWFQVPPKCGLNSSGAISTALAGLLQILECEKAKRGAIMKKINTWGNKPIEELKEDKIFNAIFRKAWILDDCSHNFSSSGMGPFSSLVGSPNGDLILYFTQKKGFNSTHPINRFAKNSEDLKPEDYEQVGEEIIKIDWWSIRLPLKQKIKEALGVAVIYCGSPKDTGNILAELEKRYKIPVENLRDLFSAIFTGGKYKEFTKVARPISDFLKDYPKPPLDTEFYAKSIFCEPLGLLSWILVKILDKGNLDELLTHITTINKYLDFYGVFNDELSKLFRAIKEINSNVGIKLTGAGGGGDLVVFGDRDSIEGVENQINKDKYPVHFSTNHMDWKAEGLRILKTPKQKTGSAPAVHNTLEMCFQAREDKSRIILVNGQSPSKQPPEGLFVYILLLAAGRIKSKPLNKITDLFFDPISSSGNVLLYGIKDFFGDPSFNLKGKVDRRDMIRSVRGNVSFELFQKDSITIDRSVRWFESEYMAGLQEIVEQKLQAIKTSKLKKDSDYSDTFLVSDDLELGDDKTYGYEVVTESAKHLEGVLENKIRRTFRYTKIVMKALEIMNRNFQDDTWREKWNLLQSNCYTLLRQMGHSDKYIEEYFYLLPQ